MGRKSTGKRRFIFPWIGGAIVAGIIVWTLLNWDEIDANWDEIDNNWDCV